MSEPVEISKIIFNPLNKNYSIHFRSLSSKKYFDYIVSADNAKKISMSSEGINSSMLSPYELYIELLDFMKFRINKCFVNECVYSCHDGVISFIKSMVVVPR